MWIVLEKIIKKFTENNKLITKSQQSKKHTIFTGEVTKISLSANDDKRVQSIDSIETYTYGRNKDLVCKKKRMYVY